MVSLLYIKHRVVGTPIQGAAAWLRNLRESPGRRRHPELTDAYLESERTATALRHMIRPDFHCIDVGAHIGSVLDQIVRLAPNGSHVAFEPVPEKAGWLRKKYPDVRVVQAATSDTTGSATFHQDLDRPGYSSLRRQESSSSTDSYDVDVVRLDDELADMERVDFMKIDVEGAELPALRGATDTIDRHRPIVLFECGVEPTSERFGYQRTELFDFFDERDYDVYAVVDFVFGSEPMSQDLFRRAANYPFRSFNYFALPGGTPVERLL